MSKPVLIGEAPGGGVDITSRPALALTGAVGRRLAELAGVSLMAYKRNGALPDAVPPQCFAVTMLAGASFGLPWQAESYTRWTYWPERDAVVVRVHHPSGRNRELNHESERASMGVVIRDALHLTPYPACVEAGCRLHPYVL